MTQQRDLHQPFCCKTLPYFGIVFQEFYPLKPQQGSHASLPWNSLLKLCPRCCMSLLFSCRADVICRWCSQWQERPPPYKPSVQAGTLICSEDRQVVMGYTCWIGSSDWSCRSAQMHVWEGEGLILSHLMFLILRLLSYSRVPSELCIFTPQAPPPSPPPTPPQPSVCQLGADCVRACGDAKKKTNVWHANAPKFSLQIDWFLTWYLPFGGLNCHSGCSLSVLVKCSYSLSRRSEHSP